MSKANAVDARLTTEVKDDINDEITNDLPWQPDGEYTK